MKNFRKNDAPNGLRQHGTPYRLFGLFAALLIVTNCTFVPLGRTEVSRAAKPNFTSFQDVNITSVIRPEKRQASAARVAALQGGSYRTGIIPRDDGETPLHARLAMMDRAQRTLDISAYIIRRDSAGFLFADRLVKAADRGVKVRLLLDDLFNQWTAGNFLTFDHHPNIEIRIFNPFSRFSPTAVDFLLDYNRVSRRMHSRMSVADNREAILGGRNIGDEYFCDNGRSSFPGQAAARSGGRAVQRRRILFRRAGTDKARRPDHHAVLHPRRTWHAAVADDRSARRKSDDRH